MEVGGGVVQSEPSQQNNVILAAQGHVFPWCVISIKQSVAEIIDYSQLTTPIYKSDICITDACSLTSVRSTSRDGRLSAHHHLGTTWDVIHYTWEVQTYLVSPNSLVPIKMCL